MLSAEKDERLTRVGPGTPTVCWCAACDLTCTVVLGVLVGTGPDH